MLGTLYLMNDTSEEEIAEQLKDQIVLLLLMHEADGGLEDIIPRLIEGYIQLREKIAEEDEKTFKTISGKEGHELYMVTYGQKYYKTVYGEEYDRADWEHFPDFEISALPRVTKGIVQAFALAEAQKDIVRVRAFRREVERAEKHS